MKTDLWKVIHLSLEIFKSLSLRTNVLLSKTDTNDRKPASNERHKLPLKLALDACINTFIINCIKMSDRDDGKKTLSLVFYVCVTCIMLTACGGGSEQSGDQLLNSAGELTAAEKATRDSKVFAVISNEDVISDPGETIVLDWARKL